MKKILCLALLCISVCVYAKDQSLVIRFENQSSKTLTFTGVSGENRINRFLIEPAIIKPNTVAIITATTDDNEDVAGKLHFSDDKLREIILVVIDPLNFHIVQPHFFMQNEILHSKLLWKIINTDNAPRALFISSAAIRVLDNSAL